MVAGALYFEGPAGRVTNVHGIRTSASVERAREKREMDPEEERVARRRVEGQ